MMTPNSLTAKPALLLTVIILLVGISIAAYPADNELLKVVPKGSLICLEINDLRTFDGKIGNLISSLKIPNVPNVTIAQLIGKILETDMESMMALENAGFDAKGNICMFWTSLSFDKFSIAMQVRSKEKAEAAILQKIGGTKKEYKGVSYAESQKPFAWAFLGDAFVYSKSKAAILEAIETHLKEKPPITADEKFRLSTSALRSGDVSGYVALDEIATTFAPMLEAKAKEMEKGLSKQMKDQKSAMPEMGFDPTKALATEIDMGIWTLKQTKSYAVSLGIGADGVWANDSLKFKPDSPICDYMKYKPGKMKLVKYLPGDVIMAGGMKIDKENLEKLYSIMFDLFLPMMKEKMMPDTAAELRKIYETATHDVLSCIGDEIAFAVPMKTDKVMPRIVYIFDISDEEKARNTFGNVDYIREMSAPFNKAFGIDTQMTEGPSQIYTGVKIESFTFDLSKMMSAVPNAEAIYPDKMLLWYAFMDGKLLYAMSQSADTVKEAIDAIKGRRASITNSPNFEDINIRLPERVNAVTYVSPAGYLNFMMSMMMSQMGQTMPPGSTGDAIPAVGFAATTNLTGDGVSNFGYLLLKEIQAVVSTGLAFGQMMKAQGMQQQKQGM